MDNNFIWMIKSAQINPTRKRLQELSEREDLFDAGSIDVNSKEYAYALKAFAKAEKMGVSVVTYIDERYPEKLRAIPTPPPVLFVRGNPDILNNVVYAGIVGARKCDAYGLRLAQNFAMEIGESGAGIISGGAEGTDTAAHEGALKAKAPTIAVLGCGIDVVYPAFNKKLFDRIVSSGGAVISEFPFGEPPKKTNFPQRNRIIAGMSTALGVIRAGDRSGALITAFQAMRMNKTVFSVPGNIDNKLSAGTNRLIQEGALVFLSSLDIIDELILKEPDFFVKEKSIRRKILFEGIESIGEVPTPKAESAPQKALSEYENEIVSIIKDGFNTQTLLEEKISFEPSRLIGLLNMMEIKGIIRKGSDKKYKIQ